jgi:valyl-tRNA synthetase
MNLKEIKNWTPEVEKEITEKFRESGAFEFEKNSQKKIYSIDTPPPYVNAPIHIGQAVTYCYMDFFARYKRMKGFQVLFPLGLDNNGLPIEMAAEKKFKISPFSVSREEFVSKCRELLEKAGDETKDTFSKLGISFTSYKEGDHVGAVYKTDSPQYRSLTQATFVELYKKGLVYEDSRINNWDSKLRTTIADSEIDYKDIESNFNDIKWKVKETGKEVVIGTTRPELISTCGRVIYNPEDERYKHLEGKTIISPIFEKEILVKAHPAAQIDKGTGLVMMCSAGDLTDIQFFREQNLKPEIAINIDGKMNEIAGPLEGLKVKEARQKIIELLKEKGLLVKQEKIIHRTPVSERTGVEIEFIEMPEFYLKQTEVKESVRKISEGIKFYPEFARKILNDWIDSVTIDWPISRRRYYATPIPLWYSKSLICFPNELNYVEPWKEEPKEDYDVFKEGKVIGKVKDFPEEKWEGEKRVFDTWMDSSISELNLLKYRKDEEFFKKAYPCSLRPQGKEIIRTWLYYTILRGYLETGKACFENAWINQHILDEKGHKMSKSKGNVIDPQKLLKDYGAEAIRMWAATEGDLSKSDLKCSEERIKGEKKTINKILNVSKFVSMFEKPKEKPLLTKIDKLFVDYIENLTEKTEEEYERYDFYNPAIRLRYFLWNVFASNYIEVVKKRVYNEGEEFSEAESDSAKWTLHYLLERFLTLIFPIIPQISSLILEEKGIDLKALKFPSVQKIGFNPELIEKIIEFNSLVWKEKKEKGISLRDSISGIKVPENLKDFEKDLKLTHCLD